MHSDTRIFVFCLFFIICVLSFPLVQNSSNLVSDPSQTPAPAVLSANYGSSNSAQHTFISWTDHGPNTCHCGNTTWLWTNQSVSSCQANCEGHANCQSISWTFDGRCYGYDMALQTFNNIICCGGWFYFTMEYTKLGEINLCPQICTDCQPEERRCDQYCSTFGFCGDSPEYMSYGTDCSACGQEDYISDYWSIVAENIDCGLMTKLGQSHTISSARLCISWCIDWNPATRIVAFWTSENDIPCRCYRSCNLPFNSEITTGGNTNVVYGLTTSNFRYSLVHSIGYRGHEIENYGPNISSALGYVVCCNTQANRCEITSPATIWETGCFSGQNSAVSLATAIIQCQALNDDNNDQWDICETEYVKTNPDCFSKCAAQLFWTRGTLECKLPTRYLHGYVWDKNDKVYNCNPTECSSPILRSLRCAEGFRNYSSLRIFGCTVQRPQVDFDGCEAYWIKQEWRDCSVTCGQGVRLRPVNCSSGVEDDCPHIREFSNTLRTFGVTLLVGSCFKPACLDTECEYSLEYQHGSYTSFPTGYILSDSYQIADESCTVGSCTRDIIGVSCDEGEGFYGTPVRVGCGKWNLQLTVTGCEVVDCSFIVDVPEIPWVSGKFFARGRIVNEVPVYFHEDGSYVTVLQYYPGELGYRWIFMFLAELNENEKYPTDLITSDVFFTSQLIPSNSTSPHINQTRPWIIDHGWVEWNHVAAITFNPICSDPRFKNKIQPANDLFSIIGDCSIAKHCVSPELGGSSNSAMCRIQILRDSFMSMKRNFTMKSPYDHIFINGEEVESDTSLPESLQIGDTFSWTSSHGVYIEWAICFTEMKSEYDTTCKYNVQNHLASSQTYLLQVSNAAIYRYSETQFQVGRGNYDTGVYDKGVMCKSFMGDMPSNRYSSANIEWETEDLNCKPSTGFVEQTEACHYVFHICPCSQRNRELCTYDFRLGTEQSQRTIHFQISNTEILGVVRVKSLLGLGSYASGIYKNGETCKRENDRNIYHSARLSWLDSSICEAGYGYATRDDHCMHTVYVCPCTAKKKTGKKGKVNLGDLATILLAVIIVLGLYLMSRCIIVFCMRSKNPVNDDIELFDIYEGMVDDIQYKSDGCVNGIMFNSEGEDSMGDVSGVVFQEGEESEFFDMSASGGWDSDNNIAYYEDNGRPAARLDPGPMGYDPSAPALLE